MPLKRYLGIGETSNFLIPFFIQLIFILVLTLTNDSSADSHLASNTSSLPEALNAIGVRPTSSKDLKLIKFNTNETSGTQFTNLELSIGGNQFVRFSSVRPIERAPALQEITERESAFGKLFGMGQAPYMGDIAEKISSCPREFGPLTAEIQFLGQNWKAFLGAAKKNFAFGACNKDDAQLAGLTMSRFDVDSKTLSSWNFYLPWQSKPRFLKPNQFAVLLKQFTNEKK